MSGTFTSAPYEFRNPAILLLCLVIVSVSMRLWGIGFGLPHGYHADEYHEILRALQLGMGSFNFDRVTKGGYYFLLFFEYGIYFVLLKLSGIVNGAAEFAALYVRDPSGFYYIGRATTAVIGTINVLLAFRLGGRAYSVGVGLLAAIFLATNTLHVTLSHYITTDVPMACLATAALFFTMKIADRGATSDYFWAAFFAGLAATTKLPAILLVIPLVVAHLYSPNFKLDAPMGFLKSRELWIAAIVFSVVLVATNPGIVGYLVGSLQSLGTTAVDTVVDESSGESMLAQRPNLFVYYFFVLQEAMGWPLLLTCLAGLIFSVWRHERGDVILLSFAIPLFLALTSTGSQVLYYPRYLLPVLIVLLILGARGLSAAWATLNIRGAVPQLLVTTLLVAVPLFGAIKSNWLLGQTDTRTLAKEWIEANIPAGAKILIEGTKIRPTPLTVPLWETHEGVRKRIEYYRIHEPNQARYLEFELKVKREHAYDLELVSLRNLESLSYYTDRGLQFAVVRPANFHRSRKSLIKSSEFMEDLENSNRARLLKRFEAEPDSRPGPAIEIYQLSPGQSI